MALVNDRVSVFSLLCRWHYFIWRERKKVNIASFGVHSNRLSNGHHISICYILHSNTQIKHILCFVFVFAFYIEYFFIYLFTKNITTFRTFFFVLLDLFNQFFFIIIFEILADRILLIMIKNFTIFYIKMHQ